ncbi:MAG: molecular chaperone DnaK, partial [Arenimonas sp.]
AMKDHGAKVPGDQLGGIETALADLETAMKGDDKGQIEAKTSALQQAAQALYSAAAAAEQGGGEAPQGEAAAKAEDVVDAEFTEVKDDTK